MIADKSPDADKVKLRTFDCDTVQAVAAQTSHCQPTIGLPADVHLWAARGCSLEETEPALADVSTWLSKAALSVRL